MKTQERVLKEIAGYKVEALSTPDSLWYLSTVFSRNGKTIIRFGLQLFNSPETAFAYAKKLIERGAA